MRIRHRVPEIAVLSLVLRRKYYRVDFKDSRTGWILMFLAFLILFFRPRHIHYTNTVSKRRSISRVHAENCCLSRGGGYFRNGLCLFILISFEM